MLLPAACPVEHAGLQNPCLLLAFVQGDGQAPAKRPRTEASFSVSAIASAGTA